MANLATLTAAIDASIKTNGVQSITGQVLNTILNSIVSTLGDGYRFKGVATAATNPGTLDNKVFYFAYAAGTYTNLGGAVLDGTSLHLLVYDTTWSDVNLGVPSSTAAANYALINGYYQSLVAGLAENIVGSGSVPASFLFRTTGGSADVGTGTAMFKSFKGNSLVWNQLVASDATDVTVTSGHKYFARINGADTIATSDGTAISVTGGTDIVIDLTKLFNGDVPDGYSVDDFKADFPLLYYAANAGKILPFTGTSLVTTGTNLYNPTAGTARLPQVSSSTGFKIQGTYTSLSFLADGASASETITPDSNGQFTTDGAGVLTITGGNSTDTMVYVYWSQEDKDYVAYEEHTLSIPVTTMTGIPSGSSTSELIYGTNGMNKAGSAYDELLIDSDGWARRAKKTMVKIDLGDLTWSYGSGEHSRMEASISDIKPSGSSSAVGNIICDKYTAASGNDVYTHAKDKIVSVHASQHQIWVYDSDYADAAAFKAAMAGVKLYYELETPIIYTLDNPIFMGYSQNDWGTEAIKPDNTSDPATAPCNCDIQYPLNAGDLLRNLVRNYVSINSSSADDSTLKTLAAAINTALGISVSWTWDESTRSYSFSVSDNRTFKVVSVPASASASGTAGNIAYDSDYLYVCVATDTWKRVALATW